MFCPSDYSPYPWMQYATQEYGVREIPGAGTNVNISNYLNVVGLSNASDETAWCSAFVNWCIRQAGLQGTGRANARSWLTWQEANGSLAAPIWGCVTILWRENPTSWKGHVGFYVGSQGSNIILLGGNQGNAVSARSYPQSRLLGYRWPARFSMPSMT